MVRLTVDIHRLVVRFPIWVELAIAQVESDVEEVYHLEIAADGDFQAELLEGFSQVLPDAVSLATRDVFEGREAIIPVEANVLFAEIGGQGVKDK